MATKTNPLTIRKHEDGLSFAISFPVNAIDAFDRALAHTWQPPSGYAIQAVIEEILTAGDPQWVKELVFESSNDVLAVRCSRKPPLIQLTRRIERWVAYGTAPLVRKVAQMGHAGDFPVYAIGMRMSS